MFAMFLGASVGQPYSIQSTELIHKLETHIPKPEPLEMFMNPADSSLYTQRLLGSSFLGLPYYRILNINPTNRSRLGACG